MAVTELGARSLRLCSLGVMSKGCCAAKRPSSSTVPNPRNAHTRNPSHSSRTDLTGRHFDNNWKIGRTSGREAQYARDVLNNGSRLKSRWIRSSRSEVDVYQQGASTVLVDLKQCVSTNNEVVISCCYSYEPDDRST